MIQRGAAPNERGTGVARLIRSVLHKRELVWELAKREMTDMHAGQAAGAVWLLVHPLLLFAVYAFMFTVVFRVRIGDRGPSDYLIYLFAGLGPWLLTQDVLSRASQVMVSNSTIVKKVMFPAEALVAKSLVSSVIIQSVLLSAIIVYILVSRGTLPAILLMLPILLLLHLALLWGVALLLSSLTPYFRDVPEIVRAFVTVNIYLMPVTYLPDMVPGILRFALNLNPFSYLIWCYQDILYFQAINHPLAWIVLSALSAAALCAGSYVFVRLRHQFSSVL